MSEEEQRISKEIPLASVLDCRLAEIIGVMHLELQLSGEIVYYIADDTSGMKRCDFSYIWPNLVWDLSIWVLRFGDLSIWVLSIWVFPFWVLSICS